MATNWKIKIDQTRKIELTPALNNLAESQNCGCNIKAMFVQKCSQACCQIKCSWSLRHFSIFPEKASVGWNNKAKAINPKCSLVTILTCLFCFASILVKKLFCRERENGSASYPTWRKFCQTNNSRTELKVKSKPKSTQLPTRLAAEARLHEEQLVRPRW